MTRPADGTVAHPLHDPVEWVSNETGVTPTLYLRWSRGDPCDTDLWTVTAASDATTITVPQPPTGFDVAALFGADVVRGRIGILADDPGDARARYAETACYRFES